MLIFSIFDGCLCSKGCLYEVICYLYIYMSIEIV